MPWGGGWYPPLGRLWPGRRGRPPRAVRPMPGPVALWPGRRGGRRRPGLGAVGPRAAKARVGRPRRPGRRSKEGRRAIRGLGASGACYGAVSCGYYAALGRQEMASAGGGLALRVGILDSRACVCRWGNSVITPAWSGNPAGKPLLSIAGVVLEGLKLQPNTLAIVPGVRRG